MSYSIGVRAATKALALAALAVKFDQEVLPHQPIHEKDKAVALATASSIANLSVDDESKDVQIYLSGSLSWVGTEQTEITGANVSASVHLVQREVATG